MSLLDLRDLSVTRGAVPVLSRISLAVAAGEFVGLVGPNGAGKTTLLRAALGLVAHEGYASLSALPGMARARQAAFLPQTREVAWPVSVAALVGLGRVPHGRKMQAQDHQAVDHALHRMDLAEFRARNVLELSGGELARALIARVLAQETPLLLADEPVAGLDPAHQIRTMQVFRDLADQGRGVVASVHDLGLAARHCTRLVVLSGGRVVADGAPMQVLDDATLATVFGIRAFRAQSDGPVLMPLSVLP
ncbi:iron complex transport system ATP-binding protein [Gemmobacter megaterium]|uniref:Iron complex transport system ATP-binding protein n=1 Tax=Gemmobacter megaterium TaxID=1086013 RepID=A0A1N7K305_9RHOB|nr:ABC transporter ATP-binding protein [Gemmobacter megaterium]GGE00155.1 ABC transporter [Gemmobacter megaterium]SIS55982.1 iron complex transport system ATP-binding protein [Gemmobacter megaterium]